MSDIAPASWIWTGGIHASQEDFTVGMGAQRLNHFHLVSVTLRGQVRYGSPHGHNFIARAGDVVFTEPHTLHQWRVPTEQGWRVFYCIFTPRPDWSRWLLYPHVIPNYASFAMQDQALSRRVRAVLRRLLLLEKRPEPWRTPLMVNALEELLLWCRLEYERGHSGLDPRVREAADYLARRLEAPLRLAEVAEAVHLSRARLAALFRRQVGMGPMRFWENKRLERAMDLLALTGRKIDAIAADLGFCDAKHFARRFKQRTGQTPSAYRKSRLQLEAQRPSASP